MHVPGDPPFDFIGFQWPPDVIEAALDRAGLTGIHRRPVTVPADALAEQGEEYWADLVSNPTFAVYRGIRP